MAEVINLRSRRKAADRAAARQTADENAARHGRSRAERDLDTARAEKAGRDLDQHRRDQD